MIRLPPGRRTHARSRAHTILLLFFNSLSHANERRLGWGERRAALGHRRRRRLRAAAGHNPQRLPIHSPGDKGVSLTLGLSLSLSRSLSLTRGRALARAAGKHTAGGKKESERGRTSVLSGHLATHWPRTGATTTATCTFSPPRALARSLALGSPSVCCWLAAAAVPPTLRARETETERLEATRESRQPLACAYTAAISLPRSDKSAAECGLWSEREREREREKNRDVSRICCMYKRLAARRRDDQRQTGATNSFSVCARGCVAASRRRVKGRVPPEHARSRWGSLSCKFHWGWCVSMNWVSLFRCACIWRWWRLPAVGRASYRSRARATFFNWCNE